MANFRIRANLGKEEALESLRSILERNPSSSYANLFLGASYLTEKRYPEAELRLKKAIEVDKKNEAANLFYGNLQLALAMKAKDENQGQQREEHLLLAWDHLKTAVHLAPNLAAGHYALSVTYAEMKDWQSAISEAKAAITLDRKNQFYFLNLGNLFIEHHDIAAARSIYQQLADGGNGESAAAAQKRLDELRKLEDVRP